MITQEEKVFRPQPGPQTKFLQSVADITIYGGAAGGGKTYGITLKCAQYAAIKPVDGFSATIFRREYPRITQTGGIWDETHSIYPYLNGTATEGKLKWEFNNNNCKTRISFHHLQHVKDKESWKGAQIPLLCFDEITEFEEDQFFYLQSRCRTTCGVKPQTVGSTNADADSWVKKFLAPWVDDTWPEHDRSLSNETRYFLREGDTIRWLPRFKKHPDAKSVKYIFASIYDNKILLKKDPKYLMQLKSLPLVDRLRLLNGDWNIRPEGGKLFQKPWFKVIDVAPADLTRIVRAWDFAATEEKPDQKKDGPDYTACAKIGRLPNGQFVVLDVQRMRASPSNVESAVENTATQDGRAVAIYAEQEPGSAGVNVISHYSRLLAGYDFHGIRSTGSKIERAKPASAQAENGNVLIVRSANTEDFLSELEAFPNARVHDDYVDAFTLAMNQLYDKQKVGGMVVDLSSDEEMLPDEMTDVDRKYAAFLI
jgi:predicted phage terminase large subunit-like protein